MSEPDNKQNQGCGLLVVIAVVAFIAGRCSNAPSDRAEAPTPAVANSAMALASDGERAEDAAAADGQAEIANDRAAALDTPITTAQPVVAVVPSASLSATGDGYIDSEGHQVASPVYAPSAPDGASAQCRDGTYSFSHSRSGTCSHHGGVGEWL